MPQTFFSPAPTSNSPSTNKMASVVASWFTVPEPIRIIFDRFPLKTLPPAPLPVEKLASTGQDDRQITLYVFNTADQTSDDDKARSMPTDPASIEILGLLSLKELAEPRVLAVSPHSAPITGRMPYLVDIKRDQDSGKKQRAVYSTPAAVYRNLLDTLPSGKPALYQSLIATSLHDAWIFTLLDTKTPGATREKVFGEGSYRVSQKQKQTLVDPVERHLQDMWTLTVAEQLRPRYPSAVTSLKSTTHAVTSLLSQRPTYAAFFESPEGVSVGEEIYARAKECLQVFSLLLDEAPHGFLGIGGDAEEASEDVVSDGENRGLGPLDIQLFAYVYAIREYLRDTPLHKAVLELGNLETHAERVWRAVY